MYHEHFGLARAPFRITPDTELFFPGGTRGEILDALVYAITSGEGMVKVVGEVGSGKTMLCRMLEERLPDEVEIVYLANPSLSPEDILHAMALELELPVAADANRLQVMHALQRRLLEKHAAGRRVVVLVEEAQSMPVSTLEEIRLLSNLETKQDKLLQIALFGQPELERNLKAAEIRQVKERITHSFHLPPFDAAEIEKYVNFRLRAVGYRGPDMFGKGAYRMLARHSEGLIRRINILADKSLLAAFADGSHRVTRGHVKTAVRDSEFGRGWRWGAPETSVAVGTTLLIATAALLYLGPGPGGPALLAERAPRPDPAAADAAPPASAAAAPAAEGAGAASGGASVDRSGPTSEPTSGPTSEPTSEPTSGPTSGPTSVAAGPEDGARAVPAAATARAVAPVPPPPAAAARAAAPEVVPAPAPAPSAAEPGAEPRGTLKISESLVQDEADPGADPGAAPASRAASGPASDAAPDAPAVDDLPDAGEDEPRLASAAPAPSAVPAAPSAEPAPGATPAAGAAAGAGFSVAAGHRLLRSRLDVTRGWLARARDGYFSIQLLLADGSQQRNLEEFLSRRERDGELGKVYVYETRIRGRTWFGVLYAEYATLTEARAALENLAPELKRYDPFIRNVSDIDTVAGPVPAGGATAADGAAAADELS